MNSISIESFFEKFINDFREINSSGGIKLDRGYSVKLNLHSVISDNMALNEMRKITTCFTSNACPWCNISYRDLQANHSNFPARTDFTSHLFHFINSEDPHLFCPDIFHDLPEGILRDFTKYFLNKYYSNQFDQFFSSQKNFKLKHGEVTFSSKTFKCTGMQQIELFIMLPFYDDEKRIDRKSPDFQFYKQLRILMGFIFAETVNSDQFQCFDQLVANFFDFYKIYILDPKSTRQEKKKKDKLQSITFKLHHLFHYSSFMRAKGPMFRYSTLRYERVHQLLKRLYYPSKSKVNIPLQMAKKYCQFKSNPFLDDQEQGNQKDFELQPVANLKPAYSPFIDPSGARIFKSARATFNGIEIAKGSAYVIGNRPIEIFKVKKIYHQNDQLVLIGQKFATVAFRDDFMSYELQPCDGLVSVAAGQIKSHKTVQTYVIERKTLLPLEFYILD